MTRNRQAGNGNVQQNNNEIAINNSTVLIGSDIEISETQIYELLLMFSESNISSSTDYLLSNPAPMNEKLIFNNAPKYKLKFMDYSNDILKIESVVEEFANSQKIIKKVRRIFLDVAIIDRDGNLVVGNGDEQLDSMFQQLMIILKHDGRFKKSHITDEVLEEFILILLAYVVFKCKILVNPND